MSILFTVIASTLAAFGVIEQKNDSANSVRSRPAARRAVLVLGLVALGGCEEREPTYEDGWTDGCEAGGHYGREQGLRAAGFDSCDDPLETWVSPWPAYLLDDDTYEAGRDEGYDACFFEAAMCAWSETCTGDAAVNPYSDSCQSYWVTDAPDHGAGS